MEPRGTRRGPRKVSESTCSSPWLASPWGGAVVRPEVKGRHVGTPRFWPTALAPSPASLHTPMPPRKFPFTAGLWGVRPQLLCVSPAHPRPGRCAGQPRPRPAPETGPPGGPGVPWSQGSETLFLPVCSTALGERAQAWTCQRTVIRSSTLSSHSLRHLRAAPTY